MLPNDVYLKQHYIRHNFIFLLLLEEKGNLILKRINYVIISINVNDVISALYPEWHVRRDVIEFEGARGTYCGIAYVVLFTN